MDYIQYFKESFLGSIDSVLSLAKIIIPLMIAMEVLKDLNILECNAIIAHKIPIFVIQFLNINQIYVLAKPEDLPNISEYLECGQTDIKTSIIEELKKEDYKELPEVETEEIKSSPESREAFYKQREEMYKNWKK